MLPENDWHGKDQTAPGPEENPSGEADLDVLEPNHAFASLEPNRAFPELPGIQNPPADDDPDGFPCSLTSSWRLALTLSASSILFWRVSSFW